MEIKRCSGAVLAGGFSTRMGTDKAALPFGGTTLLERQVRKLRALGIVDLMVSGSRVPAAGARFVPDVLPHQGPLSGIHACLLAARHESVLFLGVDIPLIPEDALMALVEAHTAGVTLLRHGETAEPLIGVYDSSLAGRAGEILRSGSTAVRRLLEETDVKTAPFQGRAELFMNCNTPAAYHALLAGARP